MRQADDLEPAAFCLNQADLSLTDPLPTAVPYPQFANLVIVLNRPQKTVNIGGTIRAMKNMGLHRLRLVAPEVYDPSAIDAIAHRSQDILASTQIFSELDSALADANFVVGMTARHGGMRSPPLSPRAAASEILVRAHSGTVALVFGPEDNGLNSSELDRCHALVTIPTDPLYASLNLAQAVLILAYEIRLATAPTPAAPHGMPASAAQLEQLFRAWDQALRDVQFFKTKHTTSILRTLRNFTHRAAPDTREVALLTAIAREISHVLHRSVDR